MFGRPRGCAGVVGGPPKCPGGLVDVREALPDVREWLFKSGWETILDVREWSVGPPGCSGVLERLSWI